ncbi:MAG TPA: arsenate reductase (glutaredoxin) [Magnetospirillaceae bacterium]|nr:arsenate reductase (glutaredoxin) [Magnetospirillaceae bacterium]
MSDFPITIFHNPLCGTSRNTLALLHERGFQPEVVDYAKVGWTKDQLKALFGKMGVRPRAMMRTKGALAGELGLLDEAIGDDAILDAMVEHPILVERPIVMTPRGVTVARPVDKVLAVLP